MRGDDEFFPLVKEMRNIGPFCQDARQSRWFRSIRVGRLLRRRLVRRGYCDIPTNSAAKTSGQFSFGWGKGMTPPGWSEWYSM